jgi:flagellar L-ring protein precursor FlgH
MISSTILLLATGMAGAQDKNKAKNKAQDSAIAQTNAVAAQPKSKGEDPPPAAGMASSTPASAAISVPQPMRPTNGSLFSEDARNLEIFGDFKPRRVGDVLFVGIAESNTATVSSNAKNARDAGGLGAAVVGAIPLPSGAAVSAANIIGALGTRSFTGTGTTGRTSAITAQIAARVVAVFPNGDVQIEARKVIKINKEEELMTLSGMVRMRDISPDGLVPSTAVANLSVHLNGKGVASEHNGPGWLARILGRISPF